MQKNNSKIPNFDNSFNFVHCKLYIYLWNDTLPTHTKFISNSSTMARQIKTDPIFVDHYLNFNISTRWISKRSKLQCTSGWTIELSLLLCSDGKIVFVKLIVLISPVVKKPQKKNPENNLYQENCGLKMLAPFYHIRTYYFINFYEVRLICLECSKICSASKFYQSNILNLNLEKKKST